MATNQTHRNSTTFRGLTVLDNSKLPYLIQVLKTQTFGILQPNEISNHLSHCVAAALEAKIHRNINFG